MALVHFILPTILIALACQEMDTISLEREERTVTLTGPPTLQELWEIVNSDTYVDECVFGEPLKDECETCSKLGRSPEAYYLCCEKDDLHGVRTWCRDFLNYNLPTGDPLIYQDR